MDKKNKVILSICCVFVILVALLSLTYGGQKYINKKIGQKISQQLNSVLSHNGIHLKYSYISGSFFSFIHLHNVQISMKKIGLTADFNSIDISYNLLNIFFKNRSLFTGLSTEQAKIIIKESATQTPKQKTLDKSNKDSSYPFSQILTSMSENLQKVGAFSQHIQKDQENSYFSQLISQKIQTFFQDIQNKVNIFQNISLSGKDIEIKWIGLFNHIDFHIFSMISNSASSNHHSLLYGNFNYWSLPFQVSSNVMINSDYDQNNPHFNFHIKLSHIHNWLFNIPEFELQAFINPDQLFIYQGSPFEHNLNYLRYNFQDNICQAYLKLTPAQSSSIYFYQKASSGEIQSILMQTKALLEFHANLKTKQIRYKVNLNIEQNPNKSYLKLLIHGTQQWWKINQFVYQKNQKQKVNFQGQGQWFPFLCQGQGQIDHMNIAGHQVNGKFQFIPKAHQWLMKTQDIQIDHWKIAQTFWNILGENHTWKLLLSFKNQEQMPKNNEPVQRFFQQKIHHPMPLNQQHSFFKVLASKVGLKHRKTQKQDSSNLLKNNQLRLNIEYQWEKNQWKIHFDSQDFPLLGLASILAGPEQKNIFDQLSAKLLLWNIQLNAHWKGGDWSEGQLQSPQFGFHTIGGFFLKSHWNYQNKKLILDPIEWGQAHKTHKGYLYIDLEDSDHIQSDCQFSFDSIFYQIYGHFSDGQAMLEVFSNEDQKKPLKTGFRKASEKIYGPNLFSSFDQKKWSYLQDPWQDNLNWIQLNWKNLPKQISFRVNWDINHIDLPIGKSFISSKGQMLNGQKPWSIQFNSLKYHYLVPHMGPFVLHLNGLLQGQNSQLKTDISFQNVRLSGFLNTNIAHLNQWNILFQLSKNLVTPHARPKLNSLASSSLPSLAGSTASNENQKVLLQMSLNRGNLSGQCFSLLDIKNLFPQGNWKGLLKNNFNFFYYQSQFSWDDQTRLEGFYKKTKVHIHFKVFNQNKKVHVQAISLLWGTNRIQVPSATYAMEKRIWQFSGHSHLGDQEHFDFNGQFYWPGWSFFAHNGSVHSHSLDSSKPANLFFIDHWQKLSDIFQQQEDQEIAQRFHVHLFLHNIQIPTMDLKTMDLDFFLKGQNYSLIAKHKKILLNFQLLLNKKSFSIDTKSPLPIVLNAFGKWTKQGKVQVDVQHIALQVAPFKQWLVQANAIRFTRGLVEGKFKIQGSYQDLNYFGTLNLVNFYFHTPYVEYDVGPINCPIHLLGNTISYQGMSGRSGETGLAFSHAQFYLQANHLISYRIHVSIPEKDPADLSYQLIGVRAFGKAYGDFDIFQTPDSTVHFTGDYGLSDATITLINSQLAYNDQLNFQLKLNIKAIQNVRFLWPNAHFPILRGYFAPNQWIHIGLNTLNKTSYLKGDIHLGNGDINYLHHNFLLTHGVVHFNEDFYKKVAPIVDIDSQTNITDSDGPVNLHLAFKGPFNMSMKPYFYADPYRSPEKIQQMLDQSLLGTSKNITMAGLTANVLGGISGDYLSQTMGDVLSNLLGLDYVSIHTDIISNVIEQSFNHSRFTGVMQYLEGTNALIGKYLTNHLFLQMDLNFTQLNVNLYDSAITPNFTIGFLVNAGLFNLQWAFSPSNYKSLFVEGSRFVLSLQYNFP